MNSTRRIGIIGDFRADNLTHLATNSAIEQAGPCQIEWLPTDQPHDYGQCDGLICSPGSPYRNEQGALDGIRYAREHRVPLLGTCGGFQHIVLEYARNVAGVSQAAHAENDPHAAVLFVTRLECSLAGKTMMVSIKPGTLAHRCYEGSSVEEAYYCNFGLNPECVSTLVSAGLVVSGYDGDDEVRIVELPAHPFFAGTLFVPQMRPHHPLIEGFYRAAGAR